MYKGIFIFLLTVSLTNHSIAQQQPVIRLSAIEFSEKIKNPGSIQLIDVRTPGEYKKGHLEGAVNIDWNGNDFDAKVAGLDTTKPVYVYCLSGGRSSGAARKMNKSGFIKVYEMPGGIMEWRASQLPEVKADPKEGGMTEEQFKAMLQSDKLVLVDFYAEWCVPCQQMKPYLNKIANEMADKVVLIRIDADNNALLCKKMNISSLPVLKLYSNQSLVWNKTGYTEEKEIREHLK